MPLRLVGVREKMIVVYDLAVQFDDAGLAEAADTAAAQIGYLDAGGLDTLQQAAVRRDMHGQFRPREEYVEGIADGRCALNCSQWMWLSDHPQLCAVPITRLMSPAGPQTYT